MNPRLPDVLRDSRGNKIRPGRLIGKGGEGAVFEVLGRNELALKLYWPDKAASRREKVTAMVAAGWSRADTPVAFPADVLRTPAGVFAGFTMRRVAGYKPVHLLYSPASRQNEFPFAGFPFLVRAALNAAKAVASVHDAGCVIGDINHSGFLVAKDAKVALIDSDSFQFATPGRIFLCEVGTPDYTPPELQNANFHQGQRTRNHDNFGLAVLIFHLLFLGRHPYAGRTTAQRDIPLCQAISEFRFAYSRRPNGIAPPPHTPLLADFPHDIAHAFDRAFGPAGLQGRPHPRMWIAVLERLERSLTTCRRNSAHHHAQGMPCPWCRMEQASQGYKAFADKRRQQQPSIARLQINRSTAVATSGSSSMSKLTILIVGFAVIAVAGVLGNTLGSTSRPMEANGNHAGCNTSFDPFGSISPLGMHLDPTKSDLIAMSGEK